MYGRSIPIPVTNEDGVTGVVYKYNPLKPQKRRKLARNSSGTINADNDATFSPTANINESKENTTSESSALSAPLYTNAWWGSATQSEEQQPQPLQQPDDGFIDPIVRLQSSNEFYNQL